MKFQTEFSMVDRLDQIVTNPGTSRAGFFVYSWWCIFISVNGNMPFLLRYHSVTFFFDKSEKTNMNFNEAAQQVPDDCLTNIMCKYLSILQ